MSVEIALPHHENRPTVVGRERPQTEEDLAGLQAEIHGRTEQFHKWWDNQSDSLPKLDPFPPGRTFYHFEGKSNGDEAAPVIIELLPSTTTSPAFRITTETASEAGTPKKDVLSVYYTKDQDGNIIADMHAGIHATRDNATAQVRSLAPWTYAQGENPPNPLTTMDSVLQVLQGARLKKVEVKPYGTISSRTQAEATRLAPKAVSIGTAH